MNHEEFCRRLLNQNAHFLWIVRTLLSQVAMTICCSSLASLEAYLETFFPVTRFFSRFLELLTKSCVS